MSTSFPTLGPASPMMLTEEYERLTVWCAQTRAACARAELLSSNPSEADSELAEACTALAALEDLILATPADSLPALALKARVVSQLSAACRHPDETDALMTSLVRDIERLAA